MDLTFRVELKPELWELTAGWINQHVAGEPTAGEVMAVAATLLHVAATAWAGFVANQPGDTLVRLDEAEFVDLARQMFAKVQRPPPPVASPAE